MDEYLNNKVSTKEETDKKCPQCGGVMNFNPVNKNLKCPYCEYETELVEELPAATEIDLDNALDHASHDWGIETKVVICKSCGGESVYDALQIADVCPYCGSNHVMEEKDESTIAPGGVVVFELTAKQASEKFENWLKNKWFCPTAAKVSAKADKFKGVYLPHWTFDAKTFSTYTGEAGVTKYRKNREGKTEAYTVYHFVKGSLDKDFDDLVTTGTNRYNKHTLDQLLPFDTANNKAYKPEYISGFVAERYSIGLNDAWKTAENNMHAVIRSTVTSNILMQENASTVRNLSIKSNIDDVKFKYLLLPIWISSFTFNNKVYSFMVNGQTGKVSGQTPIDKVKVAVVVIAVIVVLFIIFYINQN